jgi:hypothetical protein
MISKYIRYTLPIAFSALMAVACAKNDDTANTLGQDSAALNKDLQMANRDSAAQPTLNDVAKNNEKTTTPSSARSSGKTTGRTSTGGGKTTSGGSTATSSSSSAGSGAATATAPKMGTIGAGTAMTAKASSKICTNTNKVGDRFTAELTEAVHGANGAVIPAGAVATLQITKLDRQENANDKLHMEFRLVSISSGGHTYTPAATVAANEITKVKNQPKSKDVQKVVGGAAIGAVIGKVIGKSTKGAVIGAATGAAAGAATAAATANYEGCVNAGSTLTITLNSDTQVYL